MQQEPNKTDDETPPFVALDFTTRSQYTNVQIVATLPDVIDTVCSAYSKSVLERQLADLGAKELDILRKDGGRGVWAMDAQALRTLSERDYCTAMRLAPLIDEMTPGKRDANGVHPIYDEIEERRIDNQKDNLLSGPQVELRIEPRHLELAGTGDPIDVALNEWLQDLESSATTKSRDPDTPREQTNEWALEVQGVGEMTLHRPNPSKARAIVELLRAGATVSVTMDDDPGGDYEVVAHFASDQGHESAKQYLAERDPAFAYGRKHNRDDRAESRLM